ncbi:MAG: hypothetical protein WCY71_06605 [Halothiobacillaceae bacterium]
MDGQAENCYNGLFPNEKKLEPAACRKRLALRLVFPREVRRFLAPPDFRFSDTVPTAITPRRDIRRFHLIAEAGSTRCRKTNKPVSSS